MNHIPMCWKCCSQKTERKLVNYNVELAPLILVGCKENPQIKNWDDAKKLCPLLKEIENDTC